MGFFLIFIINLIIGVSGPIFLALIIKKIAFINFFFYPAKYIKPIKFNRGIK